MKNNTDKIPKVSVIIPVYGVEEYIERCAHSLFGQTLDGIEYIFVDDCTKDNSIEILKRVLEEYPDRKNQVIIHKMPSNSGLTGVRRWGMQHTTGEYVIHCDSDDWVDKTMYEKLYNRAKETDADMVICDYYRSDGTNHKYYKINNGIKLLPQGPVWNKLIRHSIYADKELMYPVANKAEDGVLVTQFVIYSNKDKIVNLHKALYYYFKNDQSICGNISEKACVEKMRQEMQNLEIRIGFLKKQGLLKQHTADVLLWKFYVLENLKPLLRQAKYYKLWKTTFPNLFQKLLLDIHIPLRIKVKVCLRIFRIRL